MENMGRVNFGPNLERQRKGIDEAYRLMVIITIIGKNIRFRWNIWNILIYNSIPSWYTGIYEFSFEADETGDTFLDFIRMGKRLHSCKWI